MKTNEKEMYLKNLEDELMAAKYNYRSICDVDFNPINERTYFNIALLMAVSVLSVFGILLITNISAMYQATICTAFFALAFILCERYPRTRKKFYLSNFSTKDLTAIKSDQFLLAEFRKHLIDNDTAVSAEFSKIAENYRKELKNKIERLSNLKESLERENLIKSMQ